MFILPSIWNIIISTIVFVIAAWYFRRLLDEHGLPKGMTRGLLVFVLAYAISWASGELVDWAHDKLYGVSNTAQPVTQLLPGQMQEDLKQLLKDTGVTTP